MFLINFKKNFIEEQKFRQRYKLIPMHAKIIRNEI